ncbi:MAG: hypothetical protein MZV70_19140 [Desulfobacterales bacterium]|nr:hypothetical protein [Desulfobacterales bacterium]
MSEIKPVLPVDGAMPPEHSLLIGTVFVGAQACAVQRSVISTVRPDATGGLSTSRTPDDARRAVNAY